MKDDPNLNPHEVNEDKEDDGDNVDGDGDGTSNDKPLSAKEKDERNADILKLIHDDLRAGRVISTLFNSSMGDYSIDGQRRCWKNRKSWRGIYI